MSEASEVRDAVEYAHRAARNERAIPLTDAERAKLAAEAEAKAMVAKPQRSVIAVKREQEAIKFTRELLGSLASSSALQTGAPIHVEDKAALVAEVVGDARGMPARVKEELKKVAERIIDKVADGRRDDAVEYAREEAHIVGVNLGAAPSWSPPVQDPAEIDAIVASIPRS